MSDKANKDKPIQEWIATMFGSSTYRDEFGSGGSVAMPKEPVVRALGLVSQILGPVPALCMESFYGRTMCHEKALRKAWESHTKPSDTHSRIVHRMGASLAVRSLAGFRYSTHDLAYYAEILFCRRERLQAAMFGAEAWYSQRMSEGESEFIRLLKSPARAA